MIPPLTVLSLIYQQIMTYLCRPAEISTLVLPVHNGIVLSMDFNIVNFSSKDGIKYNDKMTDVKITGKSKDQITINLLQDTVLITRKASSKKIETLKFPPIPLMSVETIDRESKGI